jgi:hypothetical protein
MELGTNTSSLMENSLRMKEALFLMFQDQKIEMDKMLLFGRRMERTLSTNTGKSPMLMLIPSKTVSSQTGHSESSPK